MKLYKVELDIYKGTVTKSCTECSKSMIVVSYGVKDDKIYATSTHSMAEALRIVGDIAWRYHKTTYDFLNGYDWYSKPARVEQEGEYRCSNF